MTAEPGAALSQLQILGKLEEFDPTADTVAAYVERAQLFFVVNNIPADACAVERHRQGELPAAA